MGEAISRDVLPVWKSHSKSWTWSYHRKYPQVRLVVFQAYNISRNQGVIVFSMSDIPLGN